MIRLTDVLDPDLLREEIQDGFITEREHPDDPSLKIYNYTPKAQFERHWTTETRVCRGLIVRNGQVLARPFAKFFNYGEEEANFDLDELAVVTDKADGSLGILYQAPDGLPAIATRGSFESDQAIHATRLLRLKYSHWTPNYDDGYLFEIIYPENRIVLDYGDMDDLILLFPVRHKHWPGPVVDVLPYRTLREALEAPPRENAEGFVVWLVGRNQRVKIKQEDYLALHKIVTGLNELTVWQHALDNEGDVTDLLDVLPDEFYKWAWEVYKKQRKQYLLIAMRADLAYRKIISQLPEDATRKDFALAAQHPDYAAIRSYLFTIHDNRDPFPAIWKSIRPNLSEVVNNNE